eukprot:CAMPEP_0114340374 /NCGR_PEP_ID=MMETSP0101-20121206/8338_1 /TAXON_ID=38822 ORGANISM="Pteridomonas danica, Strain PT" /NCGR_SAMPLE_ID=MMETSP0101 /ASSEMBLY_ACC=CAM_ASM_000211 /LENGTH=587 /DNA_ID=CAMNT_0001473623 /DNA_START=866 /DNA_END=2629 /DNA_ORIENTATION=+
MKINDRIRENIKIQIIIIKALRSCLSSRVVFNSHTVDKQIQHSKEEEEKIEKEKGVIDYDEYNNWNYDKDNATSKKKKQEQDMNPIEFGSTLSSSSIRRFSSIAVRSIRNHCLSTIKADSNELDDSSSSDDSFVLKDGEQVSELLRFSCQLLNELTQTPSSDKPTPNTTPNTSSSSSSYHSKNRNGTMIGVDEEKEQDDDETSSSHGAITPYARGTRARQAAEAATKQAKRDKEALQAVTPASQSYAAVAASGGFAALADAMLATDKASMKISNNNHNDENDENNMLFDYQNLKSKLNDKTDKDDNNNSKKFVENQNIEELLEDWVEIRRAGLSVFARHDILDTHGLRRFGGRYALISCFAAMKWTSREKWRNIIMMRNNKSASQKSIISNVDENKSEGLLFDEAECLAGLSLLATTHLLLRVAATDMLPLHVAVQEGDVNRIKAEIALRTSPSRWTGGENMDHNDQVNNTTQSSSSSSSVKFLDTAQWFFLECNGLAHIKDAAGIPGGFRGVPPGVIASQAVTAAGQWTMKTLGEHWPEFIEDKIVVTPNTQEDAPRSTTTASPPIIRSSSQVKQYDDDDDDFYDF